MSIRSIPDWGLWFVALGCLGGNVKTATADLFGTGENAFEIEFVTIGNPGNPADPEGGPRQIGSPIARGSVPYVYRMGKYEVSEQMVRKAIAATAGTTPPALPIAIDNRGPDKPATNLSWIEAAFFVNWLNTSSGHVPAYKFVRGGQPSTNPTLSGFTLWAPTDPGYDPQNPFRNRLAYYFIPNLDEWYKAAYHDPVTGQYFTYPTGSNVPPQPVASGTAPNTAVFRLQQSSANPADITQAGGLSPYGTMAQGGNVDEWQETTVLYTNGNPFHGRFVRGGHWGSSATQTSRIAFGYFPPESDNMGTGLRVASIPEPSIALIGFFVVCFTLRFLRRHKR